MAGLGEASAIIGVAETGLKLSSALWKYVNEVRSAPEHIRRIANLVQTTSEQLKQVGQLIESNPQTNILRDTGIRSAQRCSDDCAQILRSLRMKLCKNGWQQDSADLQAEVDVDILSRYRWPFIKSELDTPRIELDRIKLDLTLILVLASVLQA